MKQDIFKNYQQTSLERSFRESTYRYMAYAAGVKLLTKQPVTMLKNKWLMFGLVVYDLFNDDKSLTLFKS